MHLHCRNVNDAFRDLVTIFKNHSPGSDGKCHSSINGATVDRRPSRNGSVLMIDEPVTVTYTHPRERVLFNAARDANPFFHLYESLWMLAGRNDVAPLAYYAKQMAEYSDDGTTLNGAYGYRWRHAQTSLGDDSVGPDNFEFDQLDIIVNHLKADPNSRRAVLQMWNVEDDLLKIGQKCSCDGYLSQCPTCNGVRGGGYGQSKDVCCNLSVMFSLRREDGIRDTMVVPGIDLEPPPRYLDMTVTNRSNDMVWGMLGANYVHFTFLQEYMATRLGVGVGQYHHFTNNLHVYDEPDKAGIPKWQPDKWLSDQSGNYPHEFHHWVPLVRDPKTFDREVKTAAEAFCGAHRVWRLRFKEPFLDMVASPALDAFYAHKQGNTSEALNYAADIKADDWRVACTNWLQRRKK